MDEKGESASATSHTPLYQPVTCRGLHDQAQWSSCHISVLVARVRHVKAELKPGSWQLDLYSRFAGARQPRLWGPLLLSGLAAGAGTACRLHGRWQRGPGSGILPGTCTAGGGHTVCRQWCFDISPLASVLWHQCLGINALDNSALASVPWHQCFGHQCLGINALDNSALASVPWHQCFGHQCLGTRALASVLWHQCFGISALAVS